MTHQHQAHHYLTPIPAEHTNRLEPVPRAYPAPEDGRPTPDPTRHPDWKVTNQTQPAAPTFPFAANNPEPHTRPGRRWPWLSVGLYALGQVALGAAIAIGQVDPVTGLAVCLVWLVCGLLLVTAQTLSENATPSPGATHRDQTNQDGYYTVDVWVWNGRAEPRRAEGVGDAAPSASSRKAAGAAGGGGEARPLALGKGETSCTSRTGRSPWR